MVTAVNQPWRFDEGNLRPCFPTHPFEATRVVLNLNYSNPFGRLPFGETMLLDGLVSSPDNKSDILLLNQTHTTMNVAMGTECSVLSKGHQLVMARPTAKLLLDTKRIDQSCSQGHAVPLFTAGPGEPVPIPMSA